MIFVTGCTSHFVKFWYSHSASDDNSINMKPFPPQCVNWVHYFNAIAIKQFLFHIDKFVEVKMNAPSGCSYVSPGDQLVPPLLYHTLNYPADSGPNKTSLISRPRLNIKTVFPRYRQSRDRLIFNMGIPILVRRHLYIETSPPPPPPPPPPPDRNSKMHGTKLYGEGHRCYMAVVYTLKYAIWMCK